MEGRGVIRFVCSSMYYLMLRKWTRQEWDLVGFYNGNHIVLLDVYTGSPEINEVCKIEELRKRMNYGTYEMIPVEDPLMQKAFARVAKSEVPLKNERVRKDNHIRLLKTLIPTVICDRISLKYNGIEKVNNILVTIGGDPPASDSYISYHPAMLASIVSPQEKRLGSPSSHKRELSSLMEVVSDLCNNDPKFRDYFSDTLGDDDFPGIQVTMAVDDEDDLEEASDYTGIVLSDRMVTLEDELFSGLEQDNHITVNRAVSSINSVRRIANVKETSYQMKPVNDSDKLKLLQKMGRHIISMYEAMSVSKRPMLDIISMTHAYNELAETMGGKMIPTQISNDYGSYNSSIVLRSYGSDYEETSIPLGDGSTLVLPTYDADVSSLDTTVLEECLWYLDGLPDYESRFASLKIDITAEISIRRRKV